MIEKCNFKKEFQNSTEHADETGIHTILTDKIMICQITKEDCPGEKKCILYATYYEVEPEP